jgi:alpha-beta hydrolase superfamily lysophospholipase
MKLTGTCTTIFFLLTLVTASGQSMLNDYFSGNKDSMLTEATKLINMPEPAFKPYQPGKNSPVILADSRFKEVCKTNSHFFITRDKKKIFSYQLPGKSPNTIILIHGVKSDGSDYLKTAQLLQQATKAEVYALDLRGHGRSQGKPGDVDYINQYADDLADITGIIRREKPTGKIIIAGHSMGGGVTLRYTMQHSKAAINGIILFAPLIGHNSPAFPMVVAESDSTEPFMKINIARIIGLKMLNEINRHELDSLPVLFFNLPEGTPLRQYSYRANLSMAPEDYKEGLKSVKVPMLVLAGNEDEAFAAAAQQKAIAGNSKGEVRIIDGATHNSIRDNPKSFVFIKKWFAGL